MAIDYIIDYDCEPKRALTTQGIVDRLKGEERALKIIQLFRANGDQRPPSEMGFEFTRSTPEGVEENRVVVVQDLLDAAAELRPYEHHCIGCPANRAGRPFGCIDYIEYPISGAGEAWLLDRMPVPDDTLVWLLLKQGVEEFKYDGASIVPLRSASDAYFEDSEPASRILGEFVLDANQVFEMLFAVGAVNPNHSAILLLFTGAIPRDVEAEDVMHLTPAPADVESRFPFLLRPSPDEDLTVAQLKAFLHALYIGWKLHVAVLVDA
jgi:hypothetical protein